MKGKLGVLWLPKGIIRSMGNRLHPISVLGAGFVSLLIASKTLHTDPRISNHGPLLEKRGSRIHGQPYLYSPLPFPDSGMLLRGTMIQPLQLHR
jgi:hypothetical protein